MAHTCKKCGVDGFSSPLELARHARKNHKSARPRSSKKKTEAPAVEPEIALIMACTREFDAAGLDAEQNRRVIVYLNERYSEAQGSDEEGAA